MSVLSELPDEFTKCRALQHRWDDIDDDGGGGYRTFVESSSVGRLLRRCDRCGTKKYTAWSKVTGEILFSEYVYPKGYNLPGEDARPSQVRLELLHRRDAKKET